MTKKFLEYIESFQIYNPELLVTGNGLVWTLYADVVVLNDDGNVFDVAWTSLLMALRSSTLINCLGC
jgi:exosome complex RNA-binding protein Rrp42 (RNase PH superfamily)